MSNISVCLVDPEEFEEQEDGYSDLQVPSSTDKNGDDHDDEVSFDLAKMQQDLLEDPSVRFADSSKHISDINSWQFGQGETFSSYAYR